MRKLYVLVLLMGILGACRAQNEYPASLESRMAEVFSHVDSTSPGYIVGVMQEGKMIYAQGFGLSNLEHQIPIDAQTVFNVASLSKQFTAAGLALLIIDKQVSLEDPVKKYIPEMENYPDDLLVKHLVYMTSGIPEYYRQERPAGMDWSSLQFFDVDTAVAASLQSGKLEFDPGSRWTYSNINYMLLTKIVERVTGETFASFAEKRLFKPLGMNSTFVNDDIFQVIPRRALGYNYRDQENTEWMREAGYLKSARMDKYLQIHRNSPHLGGSGVYTSLEDMMKWQRNFETKELGGEEFYKLMLRRERFEFNKDNDAFGLFFGDFNGHQIVAYEGGDWGYSAYVMRFTQQKASVVCFSNLGTGRAQSKAHQVVDALVDAGVLVLDN